MAIQNQCGAQTTQQLWRRSGPDDSGVPLTFLSLSARTESKQEAAQVGGLRKVTMACLLAPALFATAERSNRWLKTWQERIGSFAGNSRRRAGSARLKVEYIANARRIIQRCERRPTPNAWNHRRRKRQFPLR
jgi:hypothetical protein